MAASRTDAGDVRARQRAGASGNIARQVFARRIAARTTARTGESRVVRALAGQLRARLPHECGIEMADLIQAGNVGLLQAARSYDSGRGAPLAGYARFRIRGEMLDMVAGGTRVTRLQRQPRAQRDFRRCGRIRRLGSEDSGGPGKLSPGRSVPRAATGDHHRGTAAAAPKGPRRGKAPLFQRNDARTNRTGAIGEREPSMSDPPAGPRPAEARTLEPGSKATIAPLAV